MDIPYLYSSLGDSSRMQTYTESAIASMPFIAILVALHVCQTETRQSVPAMEGGVLEESVALQVVSDLKCCTHCMGSFYVFVDID